MIDHADMGAIDASDQLDPAWLDVILSEQGRRAPTVRQRIEELVATRKAFVEANHSLLLKLSQISETVALSDSSPGAGPFSSSLPPHIQHKKLLNRVQSEGLRAVYPELLPSRPYCTDVLSEGLEIRRRQLAIKRRHIQINDPTAFTWMVYDIDQPGAYFAARDGNLPQPNVIATNPSNGHAHVQYLLETPVARHEMARSKPLQYFAAVERGMVRRLGADRNFIGLITKNALHRDWRVEWCHNRPYSLDELADALFTRDMEPYPSVDLTCGTSRNCAIFDALRKLAYREVLYVKRAGFGVDMWILHLFKKAGELNASFAVPMRHAELKAIASSVGRWTWKNFSADGLSRQQSKRGRAGNAKRWAVHVKQKPWLALGLTKSTYYRRKAAGTLP
jgi:hypothetical protein